MIRPRRTRSCRDANNPPSDSIEAGMYYVIGLWYSTPIFKLSEGFEALLVLEMGWVFLPICNCVINE